MYLKQKKQFYATAKEICSSFPDTFQMLSHNFNIWKSHFLWLCVSGLLILITITSFIPFESESLKITILACEALLGGMAIMLTHMDSGESTIGSNFYAYQVRKKIAAYFTNNLPRYRKYHENEIRRIKEQINELEAIQSLEEVKHYYWNHSIDTLGYEGTELVNMWQRYKRPELVNKLRKNITSEEERYAVLEKENLFCETVLKS